MKSLEELVDKLDPAWPIVQAWIAQSANIIEVLPAHKQRAEASIVRLQVSTHSILGAIAYETGGMFIHHRWLRILGSGSEFLSSSLTGWNNLDPHLQIDPHPGFFIVAFDVIGGFFAINNGAISKDHGKLYYFAPDTLEWEGLDITYPQFIEWSLSAGLKKFYADSFWNGWEKDIEQLDGDHGISMYPFLWAKAPTIDQRSKKSVPQRELWGLQQDLYSQLKDVPNGQTVIVESGDDTND